MLMIYKYILKIADEQVLPIAGFQQILDVQSQDGEIVMWVIINPTVSRVTNIEVRIFGTGRPLPVNLSSYAYMGTTQIGPFVWHIYYRTLISK